MPFSGRVTRVVVLGLSALLPLTELLRLGFVGAPASSWAVTAVGLAVLLPLHLRHVHAGLRGERPARAGLSLVAMVLVLLVLAVVVGPPVALLLATLGCSLLLALPLGRALVGLGAVMAWAWWVGDADAVRVVDRDGAYLALAVLFRAVSMTLVVWLVAAADRLAAQRAELAARSVADERSRMGELLVSVRRRAADLVGAARAADSVVATSSTGPGEATGDRSRCRDALGEVVASARDVLADLRGVLRGWSGADLAAAGELLRADGAASSGPTVTCGPDARSRSAAFERFVALVHHRPAWVVAFQAPIGIFALAQAGFSLGVPVELRSAPGPAVVVMLALLAIVLRLGLATASGRTPGERHLLLAAALGLGAAGYALGLSAGLAVILALAAVALVLGPRVGVVATVLYVVAETLVDLVYLAPSGALALVGHAVYLVPYLLAISAVVLASVYGGPMLLQACSELVETRHRMAASARDDERGRLARDLHDVLGHRLSALSLTGELALRLLERDPAAAAARCREIAELAEALVDDVDVVLRDDRAPTLHGEVEAARVLLERAGIGARVEVEPGVLAREHDALLAWAVREGITNVLRHAAARQVTVAVARGADGLALEIVNDGAHGRGEGTGRGLRGLAERAGALGGSVETRAGRDGVFVLTVIVPPSAHPDPVPTGPARAGLG